MASKAVAKKQETSGVPQEIRDMGLDSSAGTEDMGSDDFIIPRLAIAQAMSPQMTKGKGEYLPDLEPGQLFNTVTGKIYGNSVNVQLIDFHKPRRKYIQGQKVCEAPNDGTCGSPGGMNQAGDPTTACGNCVFSKWGEDNSPPECTEFKEYACLVPGTEDGPMMLQFKNTSIKVAKQLATLIQARGKGVHLQQKQFALSTVAQSSAKGDFFNFCVNNAGNVDDEQFIAGAKLYKELQCSGYKVDGFDTPDEKGNPVQGDTSSM